MKSSTWSHGTDQFLLPKSYLHESFPLKTTNKLATHTHTLEISHNALDRLQKWTESSSRKAVSLCWPLSRTQQSLEAWGFGEQVRVQYPGSGKKCWDIFIRNSSEMEARGRSEAFRVRLGQAIAQEPRVSPSFPSSGTIQ